MNTSAFEIAQRNTVCGQAQAVLDNLTRSNGLPNGLGISIEELLESAWEMAYRRHVALANDNVIVVSASVFRANAL